MRYAVFSGCSSAWLERLLWEQEVVGSNPITPIFIVRSPQGFSSRLGEARRSPAGAFS